MEKSLYTIGHSTHSIERFIELLRLHNINVLCDVRSHPYSRHCPQFNKELLEHELNKFSIKYIFIGKELGPRSENPEHYKNGAVQYQKLEKTKDFVQAIDRIYNGIKTYRVVLMCSEKDPINCHRMILICKRIRKKDIEIYHILDDGNFENNRDSEKRLLKKLKIEHEGLFESLDETIDRAYKIQSEKIAYSVNNND